MFRAHVAILVVVEAALLVASSPWSHEDKPLVYEICEATKNPSKKIETVADLNALGRQINGIKIECPDTIRSSVDDLDDLIRRHENDVCSQASANDIADYQQRHLASKNETTKSLIELPKALRDFSIAYGLKVSSFCRGQMAHRLLEDADGLIRESDFAEVAQYAGPKRYIAGFIGDPSEKSSHKHLALSGNMISMMRSLKSFDISSHEKLLMQVSTTQKVHRMQAVCEQRLRPFYKDLVLPVATLAGAGFNYKVEQSTFQPGDIKKVYEWYRIVFLCEALSKVEFFQSPEDKEKGSQSDRVEVTILTKEQADKLRDDQQVLEDEEGGDVHGIRYQPDLKSMPLAAESMIYDGSDSVLEKGIKNFRKKVRNELEPNMIRKMVGYFEGKLRRGAVKIAGKIIGFKNLPGSGKLTGVDMVKVLDEYQHALETGSSRFVSSTGDAVGGFVFNVFLGLCAMFIIGVIIWGAIHHG